MAIHEVGEHEGHNYFSMDFIAGRAWTSLSSENPLPPRESMRTLEQIAEQSIAPINRALDHDLKPSNVLIDLHDVPVVTDFGLAKQVESDSDLTASGAARFAQLHVSRASPGAYQDARAASDVYSSATFYELLTGRPPFRAESPAATMHQVVHSEAVSPRMLNPSIDRDVDTICLKCLEKEPSRRYESAGPWLTISPVSWRAGRSRRGRSAVRRDSGAGASEIRRWPDWLRPFSCCWCWAPAFPHRWRSWHIARRSGQPRRPSGQLVAEVRTSQEAATREAEDSGRLADRGDSASVLKGLDSPLLVRYGDPVQRELWYVEALTALNRDKEAAEAVEQLASGKVAGKRAGEIMLLHGDVFG